MDFFNVLTLVGGLALFLYGMNVMGGSLEKLAGGKLEGIFERLTSNPLKAVALGAGVTAVIQSSSATTVMLVGFVNAGIMKLHQAIGIIMGANIGTTATSWLLSLSGVNGDSFFIQMLKPSSFSPVLAIAGVVLIMIKKSDKQKDVGTILVGFAVLMFGMETMSGSVEGLKDVPEFTNLLLLFKNPLLGMLAGALLTAIIQSSSASVGILQALSSTGAIKFGAALPIILGQNIGTCITAILSSFGANKNAKRVAVVHLSFNVIGAFLFLVVFYIANAIIGFSFVDNTVGTVEIAIVHSIFNISTTLVLLPFNKMLEKLAYLVIKDDVVEETTEFQTLDDRFLNTPTFALEQCRILTIKMAEISKKNMSLAIDIMKKYTPELDKEINANEEIVDNYEDRLGSYLVKISSKNLSMKDSKTATTLLHTIGDFERISDHARNIVFVAQEMSQKKIEFSKQAQAELETLYGAITQIMDLAYVALSENDLYSAYLVEPLEEVVDQLRTKLKSRHINRLQKGSCTISHGFVFSDLLTNLERVSDHCSNIAVCLIQVNDDNFETHEYLRTVKTSGEEFDREVEKYTAQYKLPSKNLYS